MTGLAVVRDHLSIGALMIAVVTPEAAKIVFVSDVVVISSPVNSHIREEVSFVNILQRRNGFTDV